MTRAIVAGAIATVTLALALATASPAPRSLAAPGARHPEPATIAGGPFVPTVRLDPSQVEER